MKTRCLLPGECTIGMKLARDVFNIFGTKIALKETTLDRNVIEKLIFNKVDLVFVYDTDERSTTAEEKKVFKENYNSTANNIKEIMRDIGSGRNIDIEKVNKAGDNLINMTMNFGTGNVLSYLKQLKGVDNYTYNHSVNVSVLSLLLGRWLGFSEELLKKLSYAGLLHDVGKAQISPAVINKPSALTPEEFEIVKMHPVYGYEIVRRMPDVDNAIAFGVLMHHERENGTGYPNGLHGDEIHEFGKIIAVADVYDAMTSNRVYHAAESPFKVLEMFQNQSFGVLDTKLTFTFINNMANYYVGDFVVLSTGETGEISYINPFNISRPIIKIDNTFVDLTKESDISIEALA